ncbi:MAG TPA: hypothetical protein VNA11_03970, partial [Pseudonocardia sp.]|nr:hypothetical protein [Pseudonocardia sp.]
MGLWGPYSIGRVAPTPGWSTGDPTRLPSWGAMVTHSRSPVPDPSGAGCALVDGAAICRCAPDARYLTDEQVLDRASDMFGWQQLADPGDRAAAQCGLDELLAHARAHRSAALVADLLGIAIAVRVYGGRRTEAAEIEAMLAELSERARRAEDSRMLGEAATLRAQYNAVFSTSESALATAAEALAILTDSVEQVTGERGCGRVRSLSRSLDGLVLVLLTLGAHEIAD